jgi:ADP-ribose pyrophosphatase
VADRRIFTGKIIEVNLETATLPDGQRCELEIVRHPGGAAAVAVDAAGRVCLLRQYRHAAGGWLWELPAGKLEPPEAPLSAARRELAEEAGLVANDWQPLGSVISSPGVFTEVVHLFLARSLTTVPAHTEPHEHLEVHWLPFADALHWAQNDRIQDGKTVAGLFRAAAHL